jgi:hypothetical protein
MTAHLPSQRRANKTHRLCAICGAPSARPEEPVPVQFPALELCAEHWSAYRMDWLLLGRCVDHYALALTECPIHHRRIEPL